MLAILSNGDLASGSGDKTIKIWNVKNGALNKTLNDCEMKIWSLIEIQNRRLAAGSNEGILCILDVEKRTKISFIAHNSGIRALVLLNSGDLASGSYDKQIKIWDVSTWTPKRTLTGHTAPIWALVKLSNDDLVSGSSDRAIKLWYSSNGAMKLSLQ